MALPKLKNLVRGREGQSAVALEPRMERSGSTSDVQPRISVVVPVYNAMPYLTELLNSLEGQDLGHESFELIAVDDGSTDFSGEILDVYCARNTNFRVIHQKNSGWPGKPRNVGIAASEADYVFFCDADDVLGPEALRRMLAYADRNDVDVLTPKMVGMGGRRVQASLFRETVLDVPLRTMLRSLSPQKLVRRSLLVENDIRFHEERIRLEDGIVMSKCYLLSKRNSILADYDYYHIRTRNDGANISQQQIDPVGYVGSVTQIAQNIRHGLNDVDMADQSVLDLFRRKGLRFYEPARFFAYEEQQQRQWISAHQEFLREFVNPELDENLPAGEREKTSLIRAGDFAAMRARCAEEAPLTLPAEALSVQLNTSQVAIEVALPGAGADRLDFVLRGRNTGMTQNHEAQVLPQDTNDGRRNFKAVISLKSLEAFGSILVDCYTTAQQGSTTGSEMRLRAGAELDFPKPIHGTRVYRTAKGSLSFDLRH